MLKTPSDSHQAWMQKAIDLAKMGWYTTRPNPRVGCVIVKDGQCIGEGFHPQAGQPHAEVFALRQAGDAARGATAYVTLEPCAHFGRTPPCALALRDAGIVKVVVAMEDPNPLVSGKGIDILRQAGVEVEVGLLADQARALNLGFIQRMESGRPRVRLKMAASMDGRTAAADGSSQWITSSAALADVHLQRLAAGAILTGIGTLLADNPQLQSRAQGVKDVAEEFFHPLRVVVDSQCRTPLDSKIWQIPGQILIATTSAALQSLKARDLQNQGALVMAFGDDHRVDLAALLDFLGQEQQVNDLWVEAGATLAGGFLAADLVDEFWLYQAPILLGDGGRGLAHLPELQRLSDRITFHLQSVQVFAPDVRMIYFKKA